MNLIDDQLALYAESHTTPENEILQHLNRETHANILIPQMLSGHLQGRLLSMISKMIQPKRILEIGTYTGYSAICLAEGLQTDGVLHTIDINDELEDMIKKYLQQSSVVDKIHLHIGNALEIIPSLNEQFDLVFIDADKENYTNYYNLVFDKVNKGGYILADNVLWSGKVLDTKKDKDTEALDTYNKMVQQDKRVENVLLPVRDGIMITRKL